MDNPTDMPGLPGVLGELAELVGRETTLAIARRYGGNQIYIPRVRGDIARQMKHEGHSTAEIAAALGCTVQAVRKYTRGPN